MINKFSTLNGVKFFFSGIFQNCLVYIPAKNYSMYFSGTTWTDLWKFNGISEENTENITKSDINFAPTFVDQHLLPNINFNEHCFPKKVVNLYTCYKLNPPLRNSNTDSTLNNRRSILSNC